MSRTRLGAFCGGLAVAAGTVAGCTGGPAQQRVPYFKEGVTASAVAEHLRVALPATATDARAAHQVAHHDDSLLLSFVLPTGEVDAFVTQIQSENPVRTGSPIGTAERAFAPLGLPEPATMPGVRGAQLCAPCMERDLDFLDLAVAPLDEKSSRVYLRAVD
ncbi:hypothetical protein [Streptomyces sp. NPDC031705]|uniref:hypothetical protein n=1 Tax=Streptomyces sp. NPDC031705 TaxID=3155729 RepID=UPI003406E53F